MKPRVYMDWNATAPLRAEARNAMIAAMDVVGNPSSVHAEGRAAKGIVEKARGQVAELMVCDVNQLVFTGTATEAMSIIINSDYTRYMYSLTDHDCILKNIKDCRANFDMGLFDNGQVATRLGYAVTFDSGSDALFIWTVANGETGIIQLDDALPSEIEHGHVVEDAVQCFGKTNHSVWRSEPSFSICSGHKFGGPKGVGAMFIKTGIELSKMIKGGGQEQGRRSGTENVIGIAGFGAAAEAAARDLANGVWDQVAELRDYLETRIVEIAPEVIIFGKDVKRLPNTSNFAIPGWKGETQVMQMDLAGYAISAGSACSSGKVKVSRVLQAMGFDDVTAASAIRISLGPTNTKDEIDGFVSAWGKSYKKFSAKAA